MNGNDRQNQISPPSPSASAVVPPTHPFPHAIGPLFQLRFSYDSRTIGPISATKKYFTATTVVRFPATISPTTPHDAPRRFDENSSVETQGVAARYKSLASPSPFFGPNRNTAASWLKAAVGPKSAPEIRHRCQGVAARYKIACSPRSPPLFRPQSDHGPTLAQSYSRNKRKNVRAET